MAGASLLTLIDDIASLLDDIAMMSKVATKKTAGVLGDDLALNAQQVSGVSADRELPVVWAVAKGSMLNKLILVPAALLISAFIPWAITPILMLGGAYLCFEGAEKLLHLFARRQDPQPEAPAPQRLADGGKVHERERVKAAIRTDLILSAEIVAIVLGVVAHLPFINQVAVLSLVAFGITIGVYGLVAGIVKLDDLGLYLAARHNRLLRFIGRGLVGAAPYLMRALSVIGTLAMFMVGGGILVHGLVFLHPYQEATVQWVMQLPLLGSLAAAIMPMLLQALFGVVAGSLLVGLFKLVRPGHPG